MSNQYFNNPCQFNANVKCFVEKECIYINELECLQTQVLTYQQEIKNLTQKRFIIHDRTSLKWRDSSFYYKKRYKLLTKWLIKKGIEIPDLLKLEKESPDEKLSHSDKTSSESATSDNNGQHITEQSDDSGK
jgi:hypothetical protein